MRQFYEAVADDRSPETDFVIILSNGKIRVTMKGMSVPKCFDRVTKLSSSFGFLILRRRCRSEISIPIAANLLRLVAVF